MLEKTKLRKADAFTALGLIAFGIYILVEAFKMPMKDSWGGVMNVWYVSPAIMPIAIGVAILLLSIALLVNAVREVGIPELRATLLRVLARAVRKPSDGNVMFFAMASQFLLWVYLYIPRIDFFLNSVLFLMAFIAMFYFDSVRLLKRIWTLYLAGAAFFLAYYATGVGKTAYAAFKYSGDVLMLVFVILFAIVTGNLVKAEGGDLKEQKRKYRNMMLIAILFPLFICPVFKFLLQVPLPYEGGIIGLMSLAKFRLFPR
jgi:hypothetical protein